MTKVSELVGPGFGAWDGGCCWLGGCFGPACLFDWLYFGFFFGGSLASRLAIFLAVRITFFVSALACLLLISVLWHHEGFLDRVGGVAHRFGWLSWVAAMAAPA